MPLPEYMLDGAKKWHIEYANEFGKLFEALMKELGATYTEGAWHPWAIQTICGEYGMTCFGDWVAGRFKDPTEAKKHVDCNPFSGKWNHNGSFWGQTTKAEAITPKEFIERFEMALGRILP